MLPLLTLALTLAQQPVPVIFDTDMGNDIDDALALAMLHTLESRGESKLLAVTLTKDSLKAAQYCDIVNRFYKRGTIPIGLVRNGKTPDEGPMIAVPVDAKNEKGGALYERRIQSRQDVPDAIEVLKKALASAPDQSVVIVQVGFSTNLARLLDEPGAKGLITKKVKLLSAMAGAFPGKPEYNIKTDIPAAKKVFSEWPTPIVASGFEIGLALKYPATSIENDFRWAPHHPVVDAYRAYQKMPYDRPTWDLTSVLYGLRPGSGYFKLSKPGTIRVLDDGVTAWDPAAPGQHRYLLLDDGQKDRILRALIELASSAPLR